MIDNDLMWQHVNYWLAPESTRYLFITMPLHRLQDHSAVAAMTPGHTIIAMDSYGFIQIREVK